MCNRRGDLLLRIEKNIFFCTIFYYHATLLIQNASNIEKSKNQKVIMKQLILTFFAVILCYSLFFDKEAKKPAIDEINYIEDTLIPDLNQIAPDTLTHYTFYDAKNFNTPEHTGTVLLK